MKTSGSLPLGFLVIERDGVGERSTTTASLRADVGRCWLRLVAALAAADAGRGVLAGTDSNDIIPSLAFRLLLLSC